MKRKVALRAAAGLLTLALAAGAAPQIPAADIFRLTPCITADAAEFVVELNPDTGELTLGGDLRDREALSSSLEMLDWSQVKSLCTKPLTVFPEDCTALFNCRPSLVSADFSGADFSGVTSVTAMLNGCQALKEVNLSGLDFSALKKADQCFVGDGALETVDFTGSSFTAAETLSSMFANCYKLTSVKGLSVNSPVLQTVSRMFFNCVALPVLDLSGFRTDSVTDFTGMFESCCALTELDLSSFRTDRAETLHGMFLQCCSLRSLDLSMFNTANVTDTAAMFEACSSLRSLNLSSFFTGKVTEASLMFAYCSRLKKLNIPGFSFDSTVSVSSMFRNCYDLTELDISGFESSKLSNTVNLFAGLDHLEKLTLGAGFTEIDSGMRLPHPVFGWVNEKDPDTVVSEEYQNADEVTLLQNEGQNTYLSRGGYGQITGTKLLMTVDGSVGLRFYGTLSEYMDADDRALGDVWFHMYDSKESISHRVRATKVTDGIYYADFTLPAKNMADEIEADLYFYSRRVIDLDEGETPAAGAWSGELDRVYYSVRDYANIILSDPVTYGKEQNIVKAMLTYGGAAQRHFGNYEPQSPVYGACADLGISYTGPALETVNAFAKPAPLSGLSYFGSSVVLDSLTVQRHYFRLTGGTISDYAFTVDDEPVTPELHTDSGLYYIETRGVSALRLYDELEISAVSTKDAAQRMDFKYSALDYIRLGVENGRLKDTAAEAAKALGWLALEAKNYRNERLNT